MLGGVGRIMGRFGVEPLSDGAKGKKRAGRACPSLDNCTPSLPSTQNRPNAWNWRSAADGNGGGAFCPSVFHHSAAWVDNAVGGVAMVDGVPLTSLVTV